VHSIVVRAPATSANLGAGFDCLGLALDLWNEVRAVPSTTHDESNLILRAARATYEAVGTRYSGFEIDCTNRIVFSRGLGSSAAAIVCGVLLANHALGNPLDTAAVLDLASRLEGHPDNVAPCLYGGVRVALCAETGHVVQASVAVFDALRAVCFVPEIGIATPKARGLLPSTVSLADAVFNVGRASLMVAALASGRFDLLREATRDRLHQPYRLPLFPAGATLLESAVSAGALGAFVSGAGPTILALCTDAEIAAVKLAFESSAGGLGVGGVTLVLGLTARGAHVVD
jgi:homoserine kinase